MFSAVGARGYSRTWKVLDKIMHSCVKSRFVFSMLVMGLYVSTSPNEKAGKYGAPFSHLFTELKISPIEVHISAIKL